MNRGQGQRVRQKNRQPSTPLKDGAIVPSKVPEQVLSGFCRSLYHAAHFVEALLLRAGLRRLGLGLLRSLSTGMGHAGASRADTCTARPSVNRTGDSSARVLDASDGRGLNRPHRLPQFYDASTFYDNLKIVSVLIEPAKEFRFRIAELAKPFEGSRRSRSSSKSSPRASIRGSRHGAQ